MDVKVASETRPSAAKQSKKIKSIDTLKEKNRKYKPKKRSKSKREKKSRKHSKSKKKHKKKQSSSSSDSSLTDDSSSSSTSDSSSDEESSRKRKRKSKKSKSKSEHGKKVKLSTKVEGTRPAQPIDKPPPSDSEGDIGPSLDLISSKSRAPMTKAEYDKLQSQLSRVVDPETGRHRLIRGTGEVVEELVSRERHTAINKEATRNDGDSFMKQSISLAAKNIRNK